MGGVGLASVIAAKNRKCKNIIGIDRVESRLVLAQSLGATHTINTTGREMSEVVALLKNITDGSGPTVGIDTTAFPPLVAAMVEASRYMGKIIQVGTGMPNSTLSIHLQTFMVSGKQYFGAVQGHAKTEEYIPQMVDWWKNGLFPVEKLVKHFDYKDFAHAIKAMETGDTIKPVIVW
jgi:Zn-dependent alcohol dehydrogenase